MHIQRFTYGRLAASTRIAYPSTSLARRHKVAVLQRAFHEILTCDKELGIKVLALGRPAQGVGFVIPRMLLCTRTIGSNRLKL